MKTLIVVAHPDIARSNTQSFLQETAAVVADSQWHVLTKYDYSPAEILAEQQLVLAADRIVLQFPLYWYSAPALLWSWLDAVWQRGRFYGDEGGYLTGKTLAAVVTFSHPLRDYRVGGKENVTVDELLRPFVGVAQKTGMQYLPALLVPEFARMTPLERAQLLVHYQQLLSLAEPQSQRMQAAWFAEQLTARGATLMADTLTDITAEYTQLRQTVTDLRTGEQD